MEGIDGSGYHFTIFECHLLLQCFALGESFCGGEAVVCERFGIIGLETDEGRKDDDVVNDRLSVVIFGVIFGVCCKRDGFIAIGSSSWRSVEGLVWSIHLLDVFGYLR